MVVSRDVRDRIVYPRRSTECTLMCIAPNRRERVRDDGDEEVDKPEVEHDDAHDEEETGHEEL